LRPHGDRVDVARHGARHLAKRARSGYSRPHGLHTLLLPLRAAEDRGMAQDHRVARPHLRAGAGGRILMASARALAWVERLAWIYIYAGVFAIILGIV